METEKKKVVVVGAGMAGLTAAAYLAKNNYSVLLLDKNERTGGLLGTFEKNGFFFDSGPRAFINSGIIKPMLTDLGIKPILLENKISIGIENHLFRVDSIDDLDTYEKILLDLFPGNDHDITQITTAIRKLSDYTKVLYEFDNPNITPYLMKDKEYVFKKLLPWLLRFLVANRKLNQYKMPMEEFMGRLTQNRSIIDVITQHFFKKTPSYFALGYFYVYLDYFYPKGGTGALSSLVTEKALAAGAEIKLNKRVTRVVPAESRVVDIEGTSYPYDHLVWAADLKTLYRSLDIEGMEPKRAQRIKSVEKRVLASKGAESVFMLCLGVNRPPSYFKEHGGEHFFYTPFRDGLTEVNLEEKQDLLKNFDRKSKEEVLAWLERFINRNTYEVSVPALRDPSLAPEGQTGLMISCLFDYEICKKVEQAGWFDEFKDTVEKRMCSVFSQTVYKDLDNDILLKFSSSPLTISKLAGSSEGAITGWSFEQVPPVVHSLSDIPKSVETPIPNVLQAGQWAYVPAGVPIAMLTGWYAAQKILKLDKK